MYLCIWSLIGDARKGQFIRPKEVGHTRAYLIRIFYIFHFALTYIAPQLHHIISGGKLVYLVNICIQIIGTNKNILKN